MYISDSDPTMLILNLSAFVLGGIYALWLDYSNQPAPKPDESQYTFWTRMRVLQTCCMLIAIGLAIVFHRDEPTSIAATFFACGIAGILFYDGSFVVYSWVQRNFGPYDQEVEVELECVYERTREGFMVSDQEHSSVARTRRVNLVGFENN